MKTILLTLLSVLPIQTHGETHGTPPDSAIAYFTRSDSAWIMTAPPAQLADFSVYGLEPDSLKFVTYWANGQVGIITVYRTELTVPPETPAGEILVKKENAVTH